MSKAAAVIFADTETHGDLARAVNALETVKEFQEAGDDVVLIFDGAGTRWVAEFAKSDNRSHKLYETVKGSIAGACSFCAAAFGAKAAIQSEGIQLLDEYDHHPSLRRLVNSGYQVITF
ncbi:MAG TPA: hypothetical protein VND96_06365 [Candidatus Micrarchaeaceae archaeon]|nr:hypothetical protein [Candidatus Micrarchaeaceae archaeon]